MSGGAVTFCIAILVVAVLVLVMIELTGRRPHKFNKEEYQTRFLKIENELDKNNAASFVLAVINGDKLLDKALIESGIPGKTMGDRLKRSGNRFSDPNAVWRAHKLRNVIAHGDESELSHRQAANALAIYKQALRDLGAI